MLASVPLIHQQQTEDISLLQMLPLTNTPGRLLVSAVFLVWLRGHSNPRKKKEDMGLAGMGFSAAEEEEV